MRWLVLVSLMLAGCAAAPVARPRADRIDVSVEDESLGDVVAAIGSRAGVTIEVAPDVHERVTVSLRRIPWRDAVEVIAKMARCEVLERDGKLVLDQHSWVTFQCTDGSLRAILPLLAAYVGETLLVGADVTGTASVDYSRCAADHEPGLRRCFEQQVRENGLHLQRAGPIAVVTRAPVAMPPLAPASPPVFAAAWRAPADAWFQLLGQFGPRVHPPSGGRIEAFIPAASPEEVLVASAAAHGFSVSVEPDGLHVRGAPPRELEDLEPLVTLPGGRRVGVELQAVVIRDELRRAILSGRILAPGDEVAPGVRLAGIANDSVELEASGERVTVRPR